MSRVVNGWNWDVAAAPANVHLLVQVQGYDTWATYDPTWGKGRGSWFNDKGQAIGKIWCWREDTEAYLASRPTGPTIVPIK